ncbi:uncharacterized protein LOC141602064 [Silene latifolia]|uniref:uncharacterized protein LOC141602064 n=1 Tax=Silene latifolia TaxID=37657 RepID=UPI003D77905F
MAHNPSWDKVCSPKDEGGLGIKNSLVWNTAAVGKLVWWIYFNPDKLWVKWVNQIYLKNRAWHDYVPSGDVSWGWKNVCKVRDQLNSGYGQGQWLLDPRGYTVRSGYELLRPKFHQVSWHKFIWCSWSMPKHRFIGWLMSREALQVKTKLFNLGICPDDLCILCGKEAETHVHLFQNCDYSRCLLEGMASLFNITLPTANFLHWVWSQKWSKVQKGVFTCALMACFYQIWMQRNRARVEHSLLRPELVLQQIRKVVKMRIGASHVRICNSKDIQWLDSIDICK